MVGVPSSKGCSLCLKRAVKCDEARPSCGQCRKGGRRCPGYARNMKFIDEGSRLRHRKTTATRRKPDQKLAVSLIHQPASSKLEQTQLLATFISLMFPLGTASAQSSYLGSWLWHIPPRLGRSPAMDYASLALALRYYAIGDSSVLYPAQLAYGTAIKSLSNALAEPKVSQGPEILSATMLLSQFEAFANVTQAWVSHAGGAARLLQVRGAHRCYESAFEYSMFLACRGSIISEALLSGSTCFLDDPQWRAIPEGVIEFPLMPRHHALNNTFFVLAAALPGVLIRAVSTADERLSALSETATLLLKFKDWHRQYTSYDNRAMCPTLMEAPASFANEQLTSVYVYTDTASATMVTTCYAYLILLNNQLGCLDQTGKARYSHENFEYARQICMSTWYCSRAGHCGVSTLRMVAPIARSMLPNVYHPLFDRWITSG